jgi:hypothetical protein
MESQGGVYRHPGNIVEQLQEPGKLDAWLGFPYPAEVPVLFQKILRFVSEWYEAEGQRFVSRRKNRETWDVLLNLTDLPDPQAFVKSYEQYLLKESRKADTRFDRVLEEGGIPIMEEAQPDLMGLAEGRVSDGYIWASEIRLKQDGLITHWETQINPQMGADGGVRVNGRLLHPNDLWRVKPLPSDHKPSDHKLSDREFRAMIGSKAWDQQLLTLYGLGRAQAGDYPSQ